MRAQIQGGMSLRAGLGRSAHRRHPLFIALAVAVLLAACGSAVPSPVPKPSSAAPASATAASWTKADVEQPAEAVAAPSNAPVFCSPCHPIEQTYLQGLAAGGPGLIGVGWGFDGSASHAAVWTSADGRRWARLSPFPGPSGSLAIAIAKGSGGRLVGVGGDAHGAAAWISDDSLHWLKAPDQPALAGPATLTQMLAVVAFGPGFVAVGSADRAWGDHRAAFWTSADGLTWQRIADAPGVDGTTAQGVTVGPGGLVAVGSRGDPERGSGAAWRSTDGRTWQAASPTPDLQLGAMHAVAAGGPGFVAVGEAATGNRAVAWTSTNGTTWSASPDDPAFHDFDQRAVMLAVAPGPAGFLAAGWVSDMGNGSAAAWTSPDGRSWRRLPDQPTFSGGGMAGALVLGSQAITAGTTGWPDNKVATVWLGPAGR